MIASLPQVLLLLEIGAVVLILLYMYYAAKQQAIAWLFGIAASVLSVFLFYFQQYWGSLFLNLVYCLQGVLGYLNWKFVVAGKQVRQGLSVWLQVWAIIVLSAGAWVLYYILSQNTTMKLNAFDLILAALSIYATWLEVKKEMACWNIWIVANISYAILYALNADNSGSMYLYAVLMLLLAIFSWMAKKEWLKLLSKSETQLNSHQ